MSTVLWIALAGAAGTVARYLVGLWAEQRLPANLPYPTLIVNLSGCFAIGLVMHVALTESWPPVLRAAIVTGFLGGFTTYSSFNYETIRLLEEDLPAAFLNIAVTLFGGLALGWLGMVTGRAFASG